MGMNMTAFKAEVHRRGKRMKAERKRKQRLLAVITSTLTVFCLLFAAIIPIMGHFVNAPDSNDSIIDDNGSVILSAPGDSNADIPHQTMPPTMTAPPSQTPSVKGDDDFPLESVAVSSWNNLYGDVCIITDLELLKTLYTDLLVPTYLRSESDDAIDGCAIESEVGYIVTFEDAPGYYVECYWHEQYWYIIKEDVTVTLTESEKNILLGLLSQNEENSERTEQ